MIGLISNMVVYDISDEDLESVLDELTDEFIRIVEFHGGSCEGSFDIIDLIKKSYN